MPQETASPPATPSPALRELRDFSDRLPPVLVKELRQGLRGKMFIAGFCVLHALLASSSMEVTYGSTRFFWFSISMMFLFLLPSRNLSALGEERQEKSLDTLILTRLTPWRIVWGKWSATASLAALTAVSVLPYLLMRYLQGGTSFLLESLLLAVEFLSFCALAALFTAVSSLHSPIMRNGFAVAASLFVYYQVNDTWAANLIGDGGGFQDSPATVHLVSFAILAAWLTSTFLWQAAGSIAPVTANTAAPRRLISLAAFLALVATGPYRYAAAVFLVAALTELGGKPPPAHIPFVWRRPLRGLAAVFLAPGWASGLYFLMILGLPLVIFPEALETLLPAICAPVVYRLLLPASMRWGTAPLITLALVSHAGGKLLVKLFPPAESVITLFLPGLYSDAPPSSASLLWPAAALLLTMPALRTTLHRAALPQ